VIPPSVDAIWRAFSAAIGEDRSADFYGPFYFHNNEKGAMELANLVLAGTKRGTASLVWTYEHHKKRPPWPGSLSVMTDWHGKPLGIIETKIIEPMPFEEVTAAFAAIEGEGDGSVESQAPECWCSASSLNSSTRPLRLRPNPSLKAPTRYGSHRLVATGPVWYCPSATSRRLPPRSA
jgi:uncharacterized protein YhfF